MTSATGTTLEVGARRMKNQNTPEDASRASERSSSSCARVDQYQSHAAPRSIAAMAASASSVRGSSGDTLGGKSQSAF